MQNNMGLDRKCQQGTRGSQFSVLGQQVRGHQRSNLNYSHMDFFLGGPEGNFEVAALKSSIGISNATFSVPRAPFFKRPG